MPGESETQPLDPAKAVAIGRIVAVHGLHGDVKVEPLTDFPERFVRGAVVWLEGQAHSIERSRWQRDHVFVKLARVETREQAERLRGKDLLLPEPATLPEGEGVYYQHDIVGLRVETAAGETLGRIAEILVTGANDVYVVRGERGELLLPAIEDVVCEVDIAGGRVVVELMPGLEFRARSQGVPRKRQAARESRGRRRR